MIRRKREPAVPAPQNPFVAAAAPPPAAVQEEAAGDPLWDDALSLTGPARPQSAPDVDVSDERPWPVVETGDRPALCVMGLHGGAGASTVTALLGPDALDVGQHWPVASGWERPLPRLNVVAVARTHRAGLAAADRFAKLWAADTLPASRLVGLVLVDDGPRLTAAQRSAARRLGRMTPHGWHLPWMEAWRVEEARLSSSPLRVRQVIKNVRALARETERDEA
ncbi:DUF6668 family protein [Cellulosimicrobium marinum]|uniref:DUF6668 family protein n=1 Tax=Cellulosimicrobium marinum TaxID=1638992 RepID=UPI001E49B1C4|nr:DUF6668 family protein [Cellulosimicrobium marinum]MCB7138246.1 hypothetical protein [Cellulosimicrobium marinum]